MRLGARCSEERRLPGPERRDDPDPMERGAPILRRGPVSLSRWGGVPSAPKSRWFPVPMKLACRPSEECRSPGLVKLACQPSEECRLPGFVELACRLSEECRLPCPVELACRSSEEFR